MRPSLLVLLCALAAACSSDDAKDAAATGASDDAGGAGGAAGESGTDAGPGAGGSAGAGDDASDGAACTPATVTDTTLAQRTACAFAKGDSVATTLGLAAGFGAKLPIDHLIIVMNENRSFDHLLGTLAAEGRSDVDGLPPDYTNVDANGATVSPQHLTDGCLPIDPPHDWASVHASWNDGKMDGFVQTDAIKGTDGHYALGYYNGDDLPFYHWLAGTFAISDRYFSSVIGPTWPNREYLYAGTSNGGHETGQSTMSGVPTIFDAMTAAGVKWHVYSNGTPRQDCLGWATFAPGTSFYSQLIADLASGDLPQVAFVDPSGGTQDEHPPNNIHAGEIWARELITSAMASPAWGRMAIVYTYDEAGGLADHVPPPAACPPSADAVEFDHDGVRVPVYVVSPWARPGYVSHVNHEHASVLRLIEVLHDLPAMTNRDANSDALLDMFDFGCPSLLTPPAAPGAGALGKCN